MISFSFQFSAKMGKWADKCQGCVWLLLLTPLRAKQMPCREEAGCWCFPWKQAGWRRLLDKPPRKDGGRYTHLLQSQEGFHRTPSSATCSLAGCRQRQIPLWNGSRVGQIQGAVVTNWWRDWDLSSEEGWAAPGCRHLTGRHGTGLGLVTLPGDHGTSSPWKQQLVFPLALAQKM